MVATRAFSSSVASRRQILRDLALNNFDPYPQAATPPTLVSWANLTGNNVTINGSTYGIHTMQYQPTAANVTWIGANPISTYDGASNSYTDQHVNYGGANRTGQHYVLRFVTDAPGIAIGYVTTLGNTLNVMVDGQIANRAADYPMWNTGSTLAGFVVLTFATLPTTYELDSFAISTAGSGYNLGDTVTFTGGTFTTPVQVYITGSGAQQCLIANRGVYSVQATGAGALTQSSTSGSGTGLTLTPTWRQTTAIRKRTVELMIPGAMIIKGIAVGAAYHVAPAPVRGPRALVFGDSLVEGSFVDFTRGQWFHSGLRRLGFDDIWGSGVGGTGYVNSGTSPRVNFLGRINDITDFAPDLVVVPGSTNDGSSSAATVQANVTSFWQSVRAALPKATLVAMAPWTLTSATTDQAHADAVKNGVTAANANVSYIDTYGLGWCHTTGDWMTSPRTVHWGQQGHDAIGALFAEALRPILAAA